MKQTVKYLILVIASFVGALIFTHLNEGIRFFEAYALIVALLALFRTCKERERNGDT